MTTKRVDSPYLCSMNNNDVLRRIRYTFDYPDQLMIDTFKLANVTVSRSQVSDWLKRDTDPAFRLISDQDLAAFLNGWIITRRGERDGVEIINEEKLTNNIILRKIKIALELKDEDIIKFYDLADVRLSKHELSAFFRNPSKPQYRPCQDQFLRNFLQGMQRTYKPKKES